MFVDGELATEPAVSVAFYTLTAMFDNAARVAYTDESFHEADHDGFYVLAAAVFDETSHDTVRTALQALRGKRRTSKLHWNEMDTRQQATAAATVAALDGFHIVTVGTPVPRTRQERARAMCLTRLVSELHSYSVTDLVIEARTTQLDDRDIKTVRGARFSLPAGTRFHVAHVAGSQEPLLWSADIVAGAVRAHHQGDGTYRRKLEHCLYEIELNTHS